MPESQKVRNSGIREVEMGSRRTTRSKEAKVGKRGTVVLPAYLRRRFHIEEGSYVVTEERDDGILIRPAVILPVEIYSPRRKAEFLLSNAVDEKDYSQAVAEVRKMGLDPARIPHRKRRRA
jgi:AbrB family looped-hinge helix DNA binding protein